MTKFLRTAFAAGEAEDALAAYELASRNLWATIAERYPRGQVTHVEHSTAVRPRVKQALNTIDLSVQSIEVPSVLVTLMATIQIREQETTK